MKSFFNEFKKFIARGNVMDMAVGIIIGAAFTKIVNSLVADIIMPPLGILLGNIDFTNWFVVLKDGAETAAPYVSLTIKAANGPPFFFVTFTTAKFITLFINLLMSLIILNLMYN